MPSADTSSASTTPLGAAPAAASHSSVDTVVAAATSSVTTRPSTAPRSGIAPHGTTCTGNRDAGTTRARTETASRARSASDGPVGDS